MMKKILLSFLVLGVSAFGINAQTFTPSASALTGGTLNAAYAGQTIAVSIPLTVDVDGSVLADALAAAFPAAAPFVGLLSGQSITVTVLATTLAVEGLPSGITADCDPASCGYNAGSTGTITLSGLPDVAGLFTINITSLTTGSADLAPLIDALPVPVPGIPATFDLPQPVPGALDEEGYTIFVADPDGIAEYNDLFSLSLFPNPTAGLSTLNVKSTVAGQATLEVYSITGAMVQTNTEVVRTGLNRLTLDLESMPAGIYLVKVDINGGQALVRVQKK